MSKHCGVLQRIFAAGSEVHVLLGRPIQQAGDFKAALTIVGLHVRE